MLAKPKTKSYEERGGESSNGALPAEAIGDSAMVLYGRTHQPRESVVAYMAELCSIVEHCNFGASHQMMLHDQLVCGFNDKVVQWGFAIGVAIII